MYIQSIKFLFIGIIATLTLFTGRSWAIDGPKALAGAKVGLKFKLGAKVANQCINLQDGVHSMSLMRKKDRCSVDLKTVKFYEKFGCKGKSTTGTLGKDKGNVRCSGILSGCDECLKQSKASPIVFTYYNGSKYVTACFEDPLTPANDECCAIHGLNC